MSTPCTFLNIFVIIIKESRGNKSWGEDVFENYTAAAAIQFTICTRCFFAREIVRAFLEKHNNHF